ncbi:chemotaxis protein MotB [Paraburkholderia sp. JPY419]
MQTTSGGKSLASSTDDRDEHSGEGTEGGRWLISYADLITTMMVLFLALYALQLAKSKQLELRYQTLETKTAQQSAPPPAGGTQQDARKQLSALLDALREKGLITVTDVPHGVEIGINAKILFNAGDARLLPDSFEVLTQIAQVLQKDSTGNVLVEGHTDSVPIATREICV